MTGGITNLCCKSGLTRAEIFKDFYVSSVCDVPGWIDELIAVQLFKGDRANGGAGAHYLIISRSLVSNKGLGFFIGGECPAVCDFFICPSITGAPQFVRY
jgi:hypothetical protein